jgi:hypothetical protein
MENYDELNERPKQRHGFVTTWLILLIIINSIVALVYLFLGDTIAQNLQGEISNPILLFLALLCTANVIFAVLLLKWKKIGFFGYIISGAVALIVNLNIGIGIAQSIRGLIGIAVLYGILQIKKDNISAWENLE